MADRSSPDTAVRVTGASKAYGKTVALDDLSMVVGPGEWVGLLGPNGAGKTTLMLALAGLIELDAGTVDIFGRPQTATPSLTVGFVPQEIAVYPLLTVRENLDVFGRLNALTGDLLSQRVTWALKWTGLAPREHDQASTLSGGMKRRLNIACGVLHRPRLVLLDEPAVGVDPHGRRRIWEMLDDLRSEGTSLLMSTHELNEIESVCDRMLILDHGSVIADGTVHDLVSQTVGSGATFALTLSSEPLRLSLEGDHEIHGTTIRGSLADVATDLPRILARLRETGATIRNVSVDTPGIEAVFTSLTGRELRE